MSLTRYSKPCELCFCKLPRWLKTESNTSKFKKYLERLSWWKLESYVDSTLVNKQSVYLYIKQRICWYHQQRYFFVHICNNDYAYVCEEKTLQKCQIGRRANISVRKTW